jgi:hypothetical protein
VRASAPKNTHLSVHLLYIVHVSSHHFLGVTGERKAQKVEGGYMGK